MNDRLTQLHHFHSVLFSAGFEVEEVIADGKIHRVWMKGDRRSARNGWYVLNSGPTNMWGGFGNWKTGQSDSWSSEHQSTQVSSCEGTIKNCATSKSVDSLRNDALIEYWGSAVSARVDHPYLIKKRIPPIAIRQVRDKLLVPLWNTDAELVGIQTISPSGRKIYRKGSAPRGSFHLLGSPSDCLLIVEGYADGVSCHVASELPVAITFGAGNLLAAGKALRGLFPKADLVFIADDDSKSSFNVGVEKATEAAKAVGGFVVLPQQILEGVSNGRQ